MNCMLRSYNARKAEKHGKALTAVDRIILARSDPLTHTEFQFSEENYHSISFSSTMQDADKCCRFKYVTYSHPERWTNLVLPMTDEQEKKADTRAWELFGKKYDLIGLGSFGSSWDIIKPDPDKYWCSEACAELIKAAYGYGDNFIPHWYHPTGLFFEMFDRLKGE